MGRETEGEFGVWLLFWLGDRVALSADWSFIPREDFTRNVGSSIFGEVDRNRQVVDVTLQYHFLKQNRQSVFVEIGGGAHYNNRTVINPDHLPGFEEPGKESTKRAVWTFGGGYRRQIASHLHWISEVKVHNLARDQRSGVRVLTGLAVSLR